MCWQDEGQSFFRVNAVNSRYTLFGHPVAHSLSPRIHAAFAQQAGVTMEYALIDALPEDFAAALARFARNGGAGGNVTLPHKAAALALCADASPRARRCGAVNTLVRRGDGWFGDNTDGIGLVRDLTMRHQHDLRGRRSLLLGAGGAAAGVAPALLDAGIGELVIVNRSPGRAEAMAAALGQLGRVHPRAWNDLESLGSFDLIINATAAARADARLQLPPSLVSRSTLAVDLGYGDAANDFIDWAHSAGCHDAVDGLGMLVEQAAEAFALWHGVRPQTEPVYELLRRERPGRG
ncbi:MAG: shikimate dehydrogenase [Proteobacteria bacterium]|nr:shikimate dehydrogenase [Pseudomonadota bacterium]